MPSPTPLAAETRQVVDRYLARFPDEAGRLAPLVALLDAGGDVWSRKHPGGHLTGSAVIVHRSFDGDAVLLVHHRRLDRWLQPGGHMEAGETILDAAIREAAEEVGLRGLTPHPWHAETGLPIDVDIHPIPANDKKGEPAHFHHDFRYLFVLGERPTDLPLQEDEVGGVRWEPFDGGNIPGGLGLALEKARAVLRDDAECH